MKILIAEDDPELLSLLKDALCREGYDLETCEHTNEILPLLSRTRNLNTAVLDRMLGDSDVSSLIPELRKQYPQLAILVLSAINTVEERTKILDLGADDYVGKPFAMLELSARVRALSRRYSDSSNVLQFKNSLIHKIERKLTIDGTEAPLTNREFHLLVAFTENIGRVFNRFQLLERIWNGNFDLESNVVEVTINNLRRKLEKHGSQITILSKRNVGYWIEA